MAEKKVVKKNLGGGKIGKIKVRNKIFERR